MKIIIILLEILIFLFLYFPQNLISQERFTPTVTVSGNIQSKLSGDIQKDNEIEDILELRTRAFLQSKAQYTRSTDIVLSGLLDYTVLVGSRVEKIDKTNDTNEPKDFKTRVNANANMDLYEAYFNYVAGDLELRLGKQLVTWGRSDAYSPVNKVNPGDYRQLTFSEFGPIAIPTFSLKGTYYFGSSKLEVLWIPFFKEAEYDMFGSDFSLLQMGIIDFGNLQDIETVTTTSDIIKELLLLSRTIDSELTSRLQPALRSTSFPEDNFLNSEFAIRSIFTLGKFDIELNYLYVFNDFPMIEFGEDLQKELAKAYKDDEKIDSEEMTQVLQNILLKSVGAKLDEEGNIENTNEVINKLDEPQTYIDAIEYLSTQIQSQFQRIHIIGGGFSTTLWNFGVRGEAGFVLNNRLLTTDFKLKKVHSLNWTAGADYSFSRLKLTASAQFVQKVLLTDKPEEFLIEDKITGNTFNTVILGLLGKYRDENLKPMIKFFYSFDNKDFYISPRLTFVLSDKISITSGVNLFGGNVVGELGNDDSKDSGILQKLSDLNEAFLFMKYSF